jgi:hypothetical protein
MRRTSAARQGGAMPSVPHPFAIDLDPVRLGAGVQAHVILTQSGAQTEFWCTESPWLVTVDSRQG